MKTNEKRNRWEAVVADSEAGLSLEWARNDTDVEVRREAVLADIEAGRSLVWARNDASGRVRWEAAVADNFEPQKAQVTIYYTPENRHGKIDGRKNWGTWTLCHRRFSGAFGAKWSEKRMVFAQAFRLLRTENRRAGLSGRGVDITG